MKQKNVVVITGGSRGIGASVALEAARRGFAIILTYNASCGAARSLVDQIEALGGKAVALHLDVSAIETFPSFRLSVEQALARWGTTPLLAGLVNNAGFGLFRPIEAVSEAQFDALFDVHLKGPFFLTQTLLPLLQPGASIVNITSATTRVATAGVAPYASFKAGLQVLTRYMAKEFGSRRIRANSVSPGPIRTELGGGISAEFADLLSAQTTLGRIGEPEEVARVVATLLSEESGWINAQDIEVSGGYLV